MADYKASTVAGHTWTRAHRVTLENAYGGAGGVRFDEEQVISLGDAGVVRQPAGYVIEPFTAENAAQTFDLVNPATGEVIGAASFQDVYVVMHSLYMHLAAKRDTAVPEYGEIPEGSQP